MHSLYLTTEMVPIGTRWSAPPPIVEECVYLRSFVENLEARLFQEADIVYRPDTKEVLHDDATEEQLGIIDNKTTAEIYIIHSISDMVDNHVHVDGSRPDFLAEMEHETGYESIICQIEDILEDARKQVQLAIKRRQLQHPFGLKNERKINIDDIETNGWQVDLLTLWTIEGSTDWESGIYEVEGAIYQGLGKIVPL